MSDCTVPWHCAECGARGEIVIPATAMLTRERRIQALICESAEQHMMHMLSMRYEWPECWQRAK